jgi:hypothetical protein
MKRHLLAALLVLWTQVFAVLAPATLVHCVHEDGQSAVELCGSECCRAAHEAEASGAATDDDAAGPAIVAVADRCRDVPVQPQQTPVVRTSPRVDPAPAADVAFVAAVAWSPASLVCAATSAHFAPRGPPPDAVPRRARPSVLRC